MTNDPSLLKGSDETNVGFRSAKARPFAERKATMVLSVVLKKYQQVR
jgi:hypothetical protein